MGAPVGGIGPALDQPGRLDAVDVAAEGDRLHVEELGEARLVERLLIEQLAARDVGENAPLRAGQAELLRPLVDLTAKQPGDIMDEETEALRRRHLLKERRICFA